MSYLTVAGILFAGVGAAFSVHLVRRQLRLGESRERVVVYAAIKKYLDAVSQADHAPAEVQRTFYDATEPERVSVLFDHGDARAYIGQLRKKANDLRALSALEATVPSGPEKSSVVLKRLALLQWMGQQRGSELKRRLEKHL